MAVLNLYCDEPTISLSLQLAPTTTTQNLGAEYADGPIAGGSTLAHFSHNSAEALDFVIKTVYEPKDRVVPEEDLVNNPVTKTINALKKLIEPIRRGGLSYPPIFWLAYANADDMNGRYQLVSLSINVLMRDKNGVPIHADINVSMRKYVGFPFVVNGG